MDRKTTTAPCIKIPAADWLATNDVREWKMRSPGLATWGREPGDGGYGDVFTVYDHGGGPDSEEAPSWLWAKISKIVEDAGLDYCIVWLEDVDP